MRVIRVSDIPRPKYRELCQAIPHLSDVESNPKIRMLIEEGLRISEPAALYREVPIDERGEDSILAGGVKLVSPLLSDITGHARAVFPFVLTIGSAMDAWMDSLQDLYHRYWADLIATEILHCSILYLDGIIRENREIKHLAMMNPGSLESWPLEEQNKIFSLLGGNWRDIGVELLPTFFMKPLKTVSGIKFSTESVFEACQACSREGCPTRRAPRDPRFASKYQIL